MDGSPGMPVATEDGCMRYVFIFTVLLLGGCGFSSDHALGSHSQDSTTYANISSVITGSVTTGSMKNPVAAAYGYQFSQIYLGNEFYFVNIPPPPENRWIELNAKLEDNKVLYSFFNGTPVRKSSITIYNNADWHGETGNRLQVAGAGEESTVSINPFSNLAYWVKKTRFISFSTARNSVNAGLNLPPCRFERQLCPEHLAFLQAGNNVYATQDSYIRMAPGTPDCTGPIQGFPDCR